MATVILMYPIWNHCSDLDPVVQVMDWCLTAQAITWATVDFSLVRFCGIHLRAIYRRVPKPIFRIMSLKIIF